MVSVQGLNITNIRYIENGLQIDTNRRSRPNLMVHACCSCKESFAHPSFARRRER